MLHPSAAPRCSSTVWLYARTSDERVTYLADSDAVLVRGLIALLLRVYSGERADEIIAAKPDFIETIGLNANLSPNRANGLSAMVLQIKRYAVDAVMESRRQRPTEITPRRNTRLADDPARKTTEITPARSQRLIDPDSKPT